MGGHTNYYWQAFKKFISSSLKNANHYFKVPIFKATRDEKKVLVEDFFSLTWLKLENAKNVIHIVLIIGTFRSVTLLGNGRYVEALVCTVISALIVRILILVGVILDLCSVRFTGN